MTPRDFQRRVVFNPQSVVDLLVHYTQGTKIPLGAQCLDCGPSEMMQRHIVFLVASDDWQDGLQDTDQVQIRYDGSHIMKWTKGDAVEWGETENFQKQ